MTDTVSGSTLDGIIALFAPIVVMLVGMIVLLIDVYGDPLQRRRGLVMGISLVGLLAAFVGGFSKNDIKVLTSDMKPEAWCFGGGMIADSLAGQFCMVLAVIAALAILMSDKYLEEKGINSGEYYALILFSTAGAMLMAMSYDLINVFVALEVLSVALYILSGFARRELRSEESAVKYFLLGAFASGFLLFGTALVYGAVGIAVTQNSLVIEAGEGIKVGFTNFYMIKQVLHATATTATPLSTNPVFIAGIALLIVGLGFKAGVVPFHSYVPDVYEGAPTCVTAFMSAGAKAGAFAAFMRLFSVLLTSDTTTGDVVAPYRTILWLLAAATMIVGNVLAVRQTNIKRMLAYSSIAHAGYIMLGILASGRADGALTDTSVQTLAQSSVLYYLFAYTFMNLGAFGMIIWLGRGEGKEYLEVKDYAGLAKQQPLAAAIMAIFMLSLSGIPPAAGFFGKLYLFMSAVKAGYVGLAVVGLLASVIGVFYYLNIIVTMYFKPAEHEFGKTERTGAVVATVIAAVATLLLGVIPLHAFLPSTGQINNANLPSIRPSKAPAARPAGGASGGLAPARGRAVVPGAPL